MEEPGYAGLSVSHLQSLQPGEESQDKLKPKGVFRIQECQQNLTDSVSRSIKGLAVKPVVRTEEKGDG